MLFWNCWTMTCRFQRACCQDAVKDCLAGADWRGVRGDDHATGTASDWPKEYRVGTCWKPWIPWVENIENATQKWFKHICCLTPLMIAIVVYYTLRMHLQSWSIMCTFYMQITWKNDKTICDIWRQGTVPPRLDDVDGVVGVAGLWGVNTTLLGLSPESAKWEGTWENKIKLRVAGAKF